jgi:hypothetical protein
VISADDIRRRFRKNLGRVRHLLEVFGTLHPGTGRPSELHADVVRAAVVFLHASLEDLLRSSEELRLDHAPAKAFEGLRWVAPQTGGYGKDKIGLVDLAQYRGHTVDEVLRRAFERHHEKSNYNNEYDVVGALERMGIPDQGFKAHFADLSAMMARRHLIAHRADSNRKNPKYTNPIGVKLVEKWVMTTLSFGEQLLSSIDPAR